MPQKVRVPGGRIHHRQVKTPRVQQGPMIKCFKFEAKTEFYSMRRIRNNHGHVELS